MVNGTMQVHLNKVKLFAYHGLHAGEEILGGEFEVSVTATYQPALPINGIGQTIDYTAILEIVKTRMLQPSSLLETVATEIVSEIIAKFQIVTEVTISIFKLHPPIKSFEGSVGVCFTLKRDSHE